MTTQLLTICYHIIQCILVVSIPAFLGTTLHLVLATRQDGPPLRSAVRLRWYRGSIDIAFFGKLRDAYKAAHPASRLPAVNLAAGRLLAGGLCALFVLAVCATLLDS